MPDRTSASASTVTNVVRLDAVGVVQHRLGRRSGPGSRRGRRPARRARRARAASRRSRSGCSRRRRCRSAPSGPAAAHVVEVDDHGDRHADAEGALAARRSSATRPGTRCRRGRGWSRRRPSAGPSRVAAYFAASRVRAAADADHRVVVLAAQGGLQLDRRVQGAAAYGEDVGVVEGRTDVRHDRLALAGADRDGDVPPAEMRRSASSSPSPLTAPGPDVDVERAEQHRGLVAARDLPRPGEVVVVVDLDPRQRRRSAATPTSPPRSTSVW